MGKGGRVGKEDERKNVKGERSMAESEREMRRGVKISRERRT